VACEKMPEEDGGRKKTLNAIRLEYGEILFNFRHNHKKILIEAISIYFNKGRNIYTNQLHLYTQSKYIIDNHQHNNTSHIKIRKLLTNKEKNNKPFLLVANIKIK
jgi:hypothetical protein